VKAAVAGLGEPAPALDLNARLLAIAASEGQVAAPERVAKRRRMPGYFAAAASVAVLMVGAFTFLGATTDGGSSPSSPNRTAAIVPAADRLTQEHALTSVQAGLGGPAVMPVSLPVASSPAEPR
jgi:hypothetical protein